MYSVILCGGLGTGLWPLSRKNFPKQFLNLYSNKSLLQETYLRVRDMMPTEQIVFVTNKENYFNVVNQIKEIDRDFDQKQIVTEPASLQTLPAITCAMKYLVEIKKVTGDEEIVILPSDHCVGKRDELKQLLLEALPSVGDQIGTIGIVPTRAETRYGYIRKGEPFGRAFKIAEFAEKPDEMTAQGYVESGNFLWNSGVYLFRLSTFIEELKKHVPEIYQLMTKPTEEFIAEFETLPKISIDVGISEKSDKMVVFEGDFEWNDINSFDGLSKVVDNNTYGKYVGIDSDNIFAYSATNRLIATSGVKDLIIVENRDSILVQKKGEASQVREIVKHLNDHNYDEAQHNIVDHRPWGKYEVLIEEETVKAKKLTVYPGEKLSLQSHYHRAEHWIVVRGTAKIVNGDKEMFLHENQSTFIPPLNKHRLENPGKVDLELVEVQTGSYLGEDDIIRFEDVYKRDEK